MRESTSSRVRMSILAVGVGQLVRRWWITMLLNVVAKVGQGGAEGESVASVDGVLGVVVEEELELELELWESEAGALWRSESVLFLRAGYFSSV